MANLTATTITGNLDVTGGGVISGDGSGLSGVDPFASGTKMVFYQASAPTGWTQDTASSLSQTVMAITTGTGGGTGGSTAYFSSFLATTNKSGTDSAPVSGSVSGTVGGTTLSTPTIASHQHQIDFAAKQPNDNPNQPLVPTNNVSGAEPAQPPAPNGFIPKGSVQINPTGGSGSHSHPFNGSLASATADVSVTVPAANVKYANVIVAAKD